MDRKPITLFWSVASTAVALLSLALVQGYEGRVASQPAPADVPTVNLPQTVQAKVGRLTVIKASTNGKILRWAALTDDCDVLPYLDNSCIFSASVPGTYRVLAYTALGDVPSEPAICVVVTVGPNPLPPTPPQPPGPRPTPPNPPQPPAPADPLVAQLAAAYVLDPEPNKADLKLQLVALYRSVASTTVNEPTLATADALIAAVLAARRSFMPDTVMVNTRTAVGKFLTNSLSTPEGTPLDAAQRARHAAAYLKAAQALEAVRP